jgi:hypothetical protein
MENIQLLLSDARGIYIPRAFTQTCKIDKFTGITEENIQECSNPDNEGYWDAWQEILDNAKYTHDDGREFTLHQDGDLWLICVDKLTPEERENFGFDSE